MMNLLEPQYSALSACASSDDQISEASGLSQIVVVTGSRDLIFDKDATPTATGRNAEHSAQPSRADAVRSFSNPCDRSWSDVYLGFYFVSILADAMSRLLFWQSTFYHSL